MGEVQQQVADGARPLARVGDVIAHGEAIPANVVALRDRSDDIWRKNIVGTWDCFDHTSEPYGRTYSGWELEKLQSVFKTLRVTEVDPGPQPARCTNGPDCQRHPDADPEYTHEVDGTRMHHLGTGRLAPEEPGGTASDAEVLEVLKERDDNAEWADRLAQAIAEFLRIDIGEHSNANLPWQAALIALTDAVSPQPADSFHKRIRISQRELLDEIAGIVGVKPHEDLVDAVRQLVGPPVESGPITLSLPQVPDGAVALVAEDGTRFVPHGNQGGHSWWRSDTRGTFSLARILSELGPVTVEFAPPREPRTWPMIHPAPAWDDVLMVDVEGHGRWELNEDTDLFMPLNGGAEHSLPQLRELGEVREVLT